MKNLPQILQDLYAGHTPSMPVPDMRQAAVMIALIPENGSYSILFEKRAGSLHVQPSEICLPGGMMEDGEDPLQCAIREACEELLITPEQISPVAQCDAVGGPGGRPMWPVIAVLHDYRMSYSPEECDHVFTVPVQWFLDNPPLRSEVSMETVVPDDFPWHLIPGGHDYRFRPRKRVICFYDHPHAVIWGATASVIDAFINRLNEVL